jgi:chorismate synthase
MGRNTRGSFFCVTSFGESHGPAIGAVIDGMPAGIAIDTDFIQAQLDRRRPGQNPLTTQRKENDEVEILSGVFCGQSTGAPIALIIRNRDQRSGDYDALEKVFRPSHADYTYHTKYGIRDHRGGGRSSARITAGWVAAGAFAELFLRSKMSYEACAWVDSIHQLSWEGNPDTVLKQQVEASLVRCPDSAVSAEMEKAIAAARDAGDSLGGTIRCQLRGIPAGIGEPVFAKLHAELGAAMLSINAVKGFEYGMGFAGSRRKGSEVNDTMEAGDDGIRLHHNHSGGIQGGISNGAPIDFRVAFKPTASIARTQETINTSGENILLETQGRHDPCVLPRAVPIVEAMAGLVLADMMLAAN